MKASHQLATKTGRARVMSLSLAPFPPRSSSSTAQQFTVSSLGSERLILLAVPSLPQTDQMLPVLILKPLNYDIGALRIPRKLIHTLRSAPWAPRGRVFAVVSVHFRRRNFRDRAVLMALFCCAGVGFRRRTLILARFWIGRLRVKASGGGHCGNGVRHWT